MCAYHFELYLLWDGCPPKMKESIKLWSFHPHSIIRALLKHFSNKDWMISLQNLELVSVWVHFNSTQEHPGLKVIDSSHSIRCPIGLRLYFRIFSWRHHLCIFFLGLFGHLIEPGHLHPVCIVRVLCWLVRNKLGVWDHLIIQYIGCFLLSAKHFLLVKLLLHELLLSDLLMVEIKIRLCH